MINPIYLSTPITFSTTNFDILLICVYVPITSPKLHCKTLQTIEKQIQIARPIWMGYPRIIHVNNYNRWFVCEIIIAYDYSDLFIHPH